LQSEITRIDSCAGSRDSEMHWLINRMSRHRTLAVLGICALAGGIGVRGAVSRVLPRLMPTVRGVDAPEKLVVVLGSSLDSRRLGTVSYLEFQTVGAQTAKLLSLAAVTTVDLEIAGGRQQELLNVEAVSGNYFSTVGIRPMVGRFFNQDDGTAPVPEIVLSSDAWQRQFSSAPQAVGSMLVIGGVPHRVVGVAPPEFHGCLLRNAQAWVLLSSDHLAAVRWLSQPLLHCLVLIGRLRPGVSTAEVQAHLPLLDGGRQPLRVFTLPSAEVSLAWRIRGNVTSALLMILPWVAIVAPIGAAIVAGMLFRKSWLSMRASRVRRRADYAAGLLVALAVTYSAGPTPLPGDGPPRRAAVSRRDVPPSVEARASTAVASVMANAERSR
jgi:putative ABC transport system permease protein